MRPNLWAKLGSLLLFCVISSVQAAWSVPRVQTDAALSKSKSGFTGWERNSMPGPGHKANPGPWGPGQGSDRTEWNAVFKGSPVNSQFMIYGTDMGRMAYTNRRLNGTEFVALDVPAAHSGAVTFHPTDPQQAFLLVSCRGDPVVPITNCSGWWRTHDEGDTWEFMKNSTAIRAFRRVLVVEPTTGVLFVANPIDRNGIEVSTDDGAHWSYFALSGFHIWDLVVRAQPQAGLVAFNANTTVRAAGTVPFSLFVVIRKDAPSSNQQPSITGGPLLHFQGTIEPTTERQAQSGQGAYVGSAVNWTVKSPLVSDHVNDFALLLGTGSGGEDEGEGEGEGGGAITGRAVIGNATVERFVCQPQVTPYTSCGSIGRSVEFPTAGGLPPRPVHALEQSVHEDDVAIAYSMAPFSEKPFLVTMDGGVSWKDWSGYLGENTSYITNFVDYGPANFMTPGYHYPNATFQNQVDRKLMYIPPREQGMDGPPVIRGWMTNFLKGPMESVDGGMTWRPFAHGGVFKQSVQLAFGSTDDVIAVGKREYGLDLTRDGGLSWKGLTIYNQAEWPSHDRPPHGIPFWQIRAQWGVQFHPTNDRIILTSYGVSPVLVVRTEDAGESWFVVGNFTVDQAALADGKLLWGSSPAANEVQTAGMGQDALVIRTIAVGPRGIACRSDGTIVYASYMRSTDGGCTFQPMAGFDIASANSEDASSQKNGTGDQTVRVSSISQTDGRIILSKMSGFEVLVSTDAGRSWAALPSPPKRPVPEDALSVINNVQFAGMEAFDPRPEFNPLTGPMRILVGGMYGVWEFMESAAGSQERRGGTTASSTIQGQWSLLDNSTFRPEPRLGFAELAYIKFRVSPACSGHGSMNAPMSMDMGIGNGCFRDGAVQVAALGANVPLANVHQQRGDQLKDTQYVSQNGGLSWEDVSAAAFAARGVQSELPHHASSNVPPAWSPQGGELHMCDFTGVYALRGSSVSQGGTAGS